MLKKRIITAAVALPLFLGLLFYAPHSILIYFFCLCAVLATYEVSTMMAPRLEGIMLTGKIETPLDSHYPKWIVFFSCVVSAAIFLTSTFGEAAQSRGAILAGILISILFGTFSSKVVDISMGRVFTLLISITYGAFPWLAISDLYLMYEKSFGLILLIGIVFSGDTGAYFGGKRFGNRKLAPKISPNKTVEGAICGLISSVITALVINIAYGFKIQDWSILATAALITGVFGQLGDLVESSIKRFCLVKDSGIVFPGHGGFLDRVDGILFAAPILWCAMRFIET